MLDDKPASFGVYRDGSEELPGRTASSAGATVTVCALGFPFIGSEIVAGAQSAFSDHPHEHGATDTRSTGQSSGSRLHRETHVALFAQARLALDPVPINLSSHGSV